MRLRFAVFAIVVVLVFHAAGMVWLYGAWHKYDMLMHFAGGAAMGLLAMALWDMLVKDVTFKIRKPWLKPLFFVCCLVGFTAVIGIGWEWFEFAFDMFILPVRGRWGIAQPSIADTMADLFLDLSGALFVALLRKKV